jgi:hypothetical protein
MPARAAIETRVPAEIRDWLERELLASGFTDYAGLTDRLAARLEELGLEVKISKTALYRFGASFEQKIKDMRDRMRLAETMVQQLGDDAEGALTDASIRLAQDRLFDLLMKEELDEKTLTAASKALGELGRVALATKKHMAAVREKAAAVAETVAEKARQSGASAETVQFFRKEILGIAG